MRTTVLLLAFAPWMYGCSHDSGAHPANDLSAGADMGAGTVTLPLTLTIHLGDQTKTPEGLELTSGGDTDTELVTVGTPPVNAVRTGNGTALPSSDGNSVKDSFVQLAFPDAILFEGRPSANVIVTVEYWDAGLDAFVVEFDSEDGAFTQTHAVYKTDTHKLKQARFVLQDAFFGNRDNGADLRIADLGDGPETIHTVTFTVLPPAKRINVDDCGANPFDDLPDSAAIQACIDKAASGDVVVFSSAAGRSGYRGYLIDKTLFLVSGAPARSQLTFTSTDPKDRALLQATKDLKGFVVHLFARANLPGAMQGLVDDITVAHLHLDGDRAERFCLGPNGMPDGIDDNWGSVVTGECTVLGDSWCMPGSLALSGAFDFADATQDYVARPDSWSTGLVADDLVLSNTTCGTALGLNGAASAISKTTVTTAGDHVHATGCARFKPTESVGAWSDGFTVIGPSHQLVDNTVTDPSDVGIVLFGGHETVAAGNVVRATAGGHGMFAAIAEHAWTYGDVASVLIANNTIVNEGDATCGGIHAGINVGPHMWGGACASAGPAGVGGSGVVAGSCPTEPTAPAGAACPASGLCQQWAHSSATAALTLANNRVTGAHINYIVEGLDTTGMGLVDQANVSTAPRATDWEAATAGCGGVMWAPSDRVAHHPAKTGWTDLRIHCER